ncbi:MAG TPA: hypothetical protein VFG92_01870 [Agromyces sp.]|nr:hypothetical protein [Agromyces sp.]
MTSSQEPQLTRRELRERERLLAQQAESSTPDTAVTPNAGAETPVRPATPPAPLPAVPAPPQTPPQHTPPPPAYSAPRPAGAHGEASPFGGAIAGPAPTNPFAPPSSPLPSAPVSARYPDAVEPEPPTPERTLTRRELRAMLDANSDESFDLDLDDPAAPTAQPVPSTERPPAAPYPAAPAPIRAPAPHQVTESTLADEPVAAPKPVGHWTDQLNAPVERAEPFDQLLSRGAVSHGVPTTTNALILPNLPHHGTLGDSVTPTGDVIVTGSIDLPRSYGASGVHPSQVDSSDVDRLFDQVEDGAGVGAPIAATRAVSTQGAARAMMAPPKKEGMNVPLVLAVTAGVLALGVVATLVIGAVAGLF